MSLRGGPRCSCSAKGTSTTSGRKESEESESAESAERWAGNGDATTNAREEWADVAKEVFIVIL